MSFFRLPSKYAVAGVLANVLAYSVFSAIIFFEIVTNTVLAYQLSAVLVLPISFYLNRVWVFESRNHKFLEFIKFACIYGLSIVAGTLVLSVLQRSIENPYGAQFISMVLIGGSTFLIHWLWTFRHKPAPTNTFNK